MIDGSSGSRITGNKGSLGLYILPVAPTGLSSGAVTSSTAVINFTAPAAKYGVIGYNAYNNGVKIGQYSGATSITLTGLTGTTTYSITLAAYNINGVSTQSSALSVTTP